MKTKSHLDNLKSQHVTAATGNVFADLGFSPSEAQALLKESDARIAREKKLKAEVCLYDENNV